LEQHSGTELKQIAKRTLKFLRKKLNKKAEEFLVEASNGDARVLINVLEIASALSLKTTLAVSDIETALQRRQYTFDKRGEDFYNVISAFIKSMRASDADAALYYLARMIEAGQDPLYIARRMVIFASEDIGMAQPTALVVANEVFRACETIGYPECRENLAHGVVYLALAKKDRSSYDAYLKALDDVKKFGNLPVPNKIRNAVTKLMKDVGYGEGYEMYDQDSLLPGKLKGKKYYTPKE
jgi:putative ATPase